MLIKNGRFGEFLACSGYPECRNVRSIVTPTGVKCPSCGKDIVEKRSRRGKVFYGCSGYPECDQVFWYRPVDKKCPECGSLLVIREGKKGNRLACSDPKCKYKETISETDSE